MKKVISGIAIVAAMALSNVSVAADAARCPAASEIHSATLLDAKSTGWVKNFYDVSGHTGSLWKVIVKNVKPETKGTEAAITKAQEIAGTVGEANWPRDFNPKTKNNVVNVECKYVAASGEEVVAQNYIVR